MRRHPQHLLLAFLSFLAACGSDSVTTPPAPVAPPAPLPPPAVTVSITGPTEMYGRAEGTTFSCAYEVQLSATGGSGSEGVWSALRRTMVTTKGRYSVSDTASGEAVAEMVGSNRIRQGETLRAQLLSGFRFPNNSLDNPADGEHTATWEIDYVTGGEVRSTSYSIQCREPLPLTEPLAGRYALVSINGVPVPTWSRNYQVAADTLEFYADTTVSGRAYEIDRDSRTHLFRTLRRKYRILSRDTISLQREGGPDLEQAQLRMVRKGASLVYVDSSGWPTFRWRYDPVVVPTNASHLARMPILLLAPRVW